MENLQNGTGEYRSSYKRTYIVASIIIIILIAALLLLLNNSKSRPPSYTVPPTNEILNLSNSTIVNFVNSYNPGIKAPSSITYYYLPDNSSCSKIEFFKYYQNETNGSVSFVSFSVSRINQSIITQYYNSFYSNGGYCRSAFDAVEHNSSETTSDYQYGNLTVYVSAFHGFNSNGLSLAGNQHVTNITDPYWDMYSAVYKNMKLEVSIWGIYSYQNQTRNRDIADSFFSSFMSKLGS